MKPPVLRKLHFVENATAHLLRNTGYHKHIRPVLYPLQCLPRDYQIKFKVSGFIYKELNGLGTGYLKIN